MLILETYFFRLMVYSILGWIYESIVCSIQEKKWVNRGFLNGPYCPIYGAGAVLDIIILGNIQNPILLFLLGATLTCTLEYLTSYFMEKIFNARWWDYSDFKFNLNGRICLLGAVVFGAFSVLLIKVLHPIIDGYFTSILEPWFHTTVVTLFVIFVADLIITIHGLTGFREKLKILSEYYEKTLISNASTGIQEKFNAGYNAIINTFSNQQKRIIEAFPKLIESLDRIKEKAEEFRDRGLTGR